MKNLQFRTYIILIISCFTTVLYAQSSNSNGAVNDTISVDPKIPELKIFIESALKNSPLLKASDMQIERVFEQIKKEKKSWTDFIFIDANARYGLLDQVTISDQTGASLGIKSAKEQFNYFAGLTFRIPISSFVSKKNDLKMLNNDLEGSKLKKEQLKSELTQLVIDEYFKLINMNQSLQINQNILQSLKLNMVKAQKDINTGVIGLSDYNSVLTTKEKAEESYYKAQNEYFAQFYKIQVLTGLNLNEKK